MWVVDLSKVEKKLDRIPDHIRDALYFWQSQIHRIGLLEVRKIPGYHDEPLKGHRSGERSIRLNRSWRAIYQESPNGQITIIKVQEISKHEY